MAEVELRIGSDEAEIAWVCGRLPSHGYRVNRLTGEVVVMVREEDLRDMLSSRRAVNAA
ncbi:hypothetical protein [Streptomyces sp. NRRL F-4489]|uniref:hypothetical protein n=1 Tax=Streptomyces sp. NRRL F-4489 TaxID=1609095 RepID=UPI00131E62A3|nr:hypothetical protein [Streptomyces sp. NRRL F-4489]